MKPVLSLSLAYHKADSLMPQNSLRGGNNRWKWKWYFTINLLFVNVLGKNDKTTLVVLLYSIEILQ